MENDPLSPWVILTAVNITYVSFNLISWIGFIITIILIIFSALISGAEVAFFTLSPEELIKIKESNSKKSNIALKLTNKPHDLLATLLVANIFFKITIVILSSFVMNTLIIFENAPILEFLIQVVLITFVILLFGTIIPKLYAHQYSYKVVLIMALPVHILTLLLKPISLFLVSSSRFIDKYYRKKTNFSINDLSNALDLPSDALPEEKGILKGIIEFRNTEVSEIMCARVNVLAIEIATNFNKVLNQIVDAGYSRIPVYAKTFDNVKGILYIKDLLPHIQKPETFHWQSLIRPPYFIPEKKKINDLLKELQTDKTHMAIVVDEYGGTSGIITMEDIIEEIVGDISDTFDDEVNFAKINDNNYLFEGKTLLNDFYKILELENSIFDEIKGDAETLAGLILEVKGEFPNLHDRISYKEFTFTIEALDKRRIVKIKTTINR